LPPTVTKNGREHTVPIGSLGQRILNIATKDTGRTLLFAARGKSQSPFNGWSKAKAAFDEISGVQSWTLHDLRRTYASHMAPIGVPLHVIEKLLNHVGGILVVYQRHQ
jgi:integrase